jgi:hypothetical protein
MFPYRRLWTEGTERYSNGFRQEGKQAESKGKERSEEWRELLKQKFSSLHNNAFNMCPKLKRLLRLLKVELT